MPKNVSTPLQRFLLANKNLINMKEICRIAKINYSNFGPRLRGTVPFTEAEAAAIKSVILKWADDAKQL
jgi:hypothetical protein